MTAAEFDRQFQLFRFEWEELFDRAGITPECLAALGLRRSATVEEVKQSFRQLSKTHHPDRGGEPEAFVRLRAYYEEALLFAKSRMAGSAVAG